MKGQGVQVLIVEDEFIIADQIENVVLDLGYEVLGPAATVDGALKLLERERPDVALLDANLRGEISAAVAQALSAARIPFCLCSGYRQDDLSEKFGRVRTIAKPLNERELTSALKDLCEEAVAARPGSSV